MEAVRTEMEGNLSKGLRVENCLEMIEQGEARGLELLEQECYKMLRDKFGVISQQDGFLRLGEEIMEVLLEEDELGSNREEDVFEVIVSWIPFSGSKSDEEIRVEGLLGKIRYGLMSDKYLAGLMNSASLPGHGMVKELVGEAMAKNGGTGGEGMLDGVERLCFKWMVARGMKDRIIGADVLKSPEYVALDGQGRIVVSDSKLHAIIVFNHDGSVARRFGCKGQLGVPMGVAVDRQGRIVVADSGNHRIQVLNADGSVARCFGSVSAAVGQFKGPWGVAIDSEGHIVVADQLNHRIQVFDADGSVVRLFAIGQLDHPTGVAVDGAGRIVVVDYGNHRVQVFNCDGSVALCFGSEGDGPGQLRKPEGVAVDSAGRFVVSDAFNNRVQVFNPDGSVARVIGSGGDGVGELNNPYAWW